MLSFTTVTQIAVTISLGLGLWLANGLSAVSEQQNANAVNIAQTQQKVADMDARTIRIENKLDALLSSKR